jgi:hypothetical protein
MARDGQINFKHEEEGSRYMMQTRRNDDGQPVFLGATKLADGGARLITQRVRYMRPHLHDLDCPDGEWIGRLRAKELRDQKNVLVLYFEDESGMPSWFLVYARDAYMARDGQINFKDEDAGGRYRLNTRLSAEGVPLLLGATKLADGDAG